MLHTLILVWSSLLVGLDPSILTLAWNAKGFLPEEMVVEREHRIRGQGPISIPWLYLADATHPLQNAELEKCEVNNDMVISVMNAHQATFLFQFSSLPAASRQPIENIEAGNNEAGTQLPALTCIALENKRAVKNVVELICVTSRDLLQFHGRVVQRGVVDIQPRWQQQCHAWSDRLCALQTDSIIRKLNNIGNKSTHQVVIDPYWAHYDNYDRWNVVLSNPIPHKPRIHHRLPHQTLSEAIVKLGLRLESLVDRSHELWQIQLQLMENLRTAGVRLWQPWSNEVSIETPVAEMPSAVEEMPRTSEAAPTLNNIESIDSSMDLEPGEINGCLFFDGEN